MSTSRESRVLTRSSTKGKGKLIEPPIVELRSPSAKIHVTELEVEALKEVEVNTLVVVVRKKRKLVLPASSSSSSHHSTKFFRKRLPVPGSLQRERRKTSLFIMLEHHILIPRTSYV